MKILIAPDKFKGSLSAQEVCLALERGIKSYDQNIETILCPMADGGDGSLAVLKHYLDLQTVSLEVKDPLMRPTRADYNIGNSVAFIEMSKASGLALLHPSERNAMLTSSFGTGQLIANALQRGVIEIYLFIGGSATNDGAIGIANALGYRFLDKKEEELSPIGKNLIHIARIDDSNLHFDLEKIKIKVVCDVNNPLYGKNGAAYVYGPQKGATTEEVVALDNGLQNLRSILLNQGYPDISNISGSGAAGGIGGGSIAFLGAELISGIHIFLDITQLEEHIQNSDLVITGEGKLDSQTEQGKVISGVSQLARKYKVPIFAACGAADLAAGEALGIKRIYTVMERSATLEEAMSKASGKLEEIGRELASDF